MRDELIHKYLSFAEAIAKKYHRIHPYIDLSDLISAANLGLVDAANKFDPLKGGFSTYAYYRIRGEIYSWIASESRDRKVSLDFDLAVVKEKDNFDYLIEGLSPLGRTILIWYYKEGLTTKEIGNRIGKRQPMVSKLLHKFIGQLRRAK